MSKKEHPIRPRFIVPADVGRHACLVPAGRLSHEDLDDLEAACDRDDNRGRAATMLRIPAQTPGPYEVIRPREVELSWF